MPNYRAKEWVSNLAVAALVVTALVVAFLAFHPPRQDSPTAPAPRPADLPPLQPLDCAFYRKAHDLDPGTIRVLLRNTGSGPLSFKQVLLDEAPIPVWGVDWHKGVTPDVPAETPKDADAHSVPKQPTAEPPAPAARGHGASHSGRL